MVSNYAMTIASMAKMALLGAAATVLLLASSSALAQATSRPCNADGLDNELPGPACLLAHAPLGKPPADALYWSLYNYPTVEAARAESGRQQHDRTRRPAYVAYGFGAGPSKGFRAYFA